jgi:hypothetical protein
MMVTILRVSALAGEVASAGALGAAAVRVPHSRQNFAAGGSSTPQLAQHTAKGVPHSRQNFARSGLVCPQAEQFTEAL